MTTFFRPSNEAERRLAAAFSDAVHEADLNRYLVTQSTLLFPLAPNDRGVPCPALVRVDERRGVAAYTSRHQLLVAAAAGLWAKEGVAVDIRPAEVARDWDHALIINPGGDLGWAIDAESVTRLAAEWRAENGVSDD